MYVYYIRVLVVIAAVGLSSNALARFAEQGPSGPRSFSVLDVKIAILAIEIDQIYPFLSSPS